MGAASGLYDLMEVIADPTDAVEDAADAVGYQRSTS